MRLMLNDQGATPAPPVAQQTAPAQTSTDTPANYLLDDGDTLALFIFNHPDLSGNFFVPTGGIVQFPVIGGIKVSGKTLEQVAAALNHAYGEQLLLKPKITLTVSIPRTTPGVGVMGDVQKAGAIPLLPNTTLAAAISAAGGILPGIKMSDVTVTLLPKGGEPKSFSMEDILTGSTQSNLFVHAGDTVEVEAGGIPVYVVGQVKTPGLQQLARNSGPLQAIASAGGALDSASISHVRVTHMDGTTEVHDLTPSLVHSALQILPPLRKGDLVTVAQNLNQLAVLGYVMTPGLYPIPDGQTYRLSDAIAVAKGQDALKRGSFTHVVIARKVGGKAVHFVYDLNKFFRKGDASQNPFLFPDDVVYVPETNAPAITAITSAIASLGIFFEGTKIGS